ncbi:unnamed protein product [Rotaria magnacalcarata]|uniref:Uncharacterized protein n=1 Tax=Rotaria magnacalcarata TaxID=392030 RepID=A0A816M4C1_9BILA|nr:unnamed protein product [Rotaria magnacalcarata]CAF1497069.1 unnamed protein product [Rotaria magnacalcarata]CAF1989154.1 unnamed protein product [Rotaria magnacalcarata]CAF2116826.1 unnamed protein product [Rotaria magnacalcarata]CAF2135013.1 unnamed protein product [Rotaria magnacalcarata]
MPRVQFIGQISLSFGNTLPELCSKLKNFGIGRLFVRTAQDQNKEVSYVVLTKSRPMITQTPPKIIIGKLDEITILTRKLPDTQSEFVGRIVENGLVLNSGRETKIPSATNPDWRLIRKEDEAYYLKHTNKTQETSDKNREKTNISLLQEHIPDIIKFWARTNG